MTLDSRSAELAQQIGDRIMHLHLHPDEVYADFARHQATRAALLRDSFAYHFAENERYRQFAIHAGVQPGPELRLGEIPLLPSGLFKRSGVELLSTPASSIIKYCESSGTSGSVSVVPRDESTLSNFLGSISSIFPSFLQIERTGKQRGFVLGPSADDAGDLWFSYVISCVSLMMQTEFMERDGQIDMARTAQRVRAALAEDLDVVIIGPPFLILELSEHVAKQADWPRLSARSFVVSAGGWKSRQRESIDDVRYRQAVAERLKLPSESALRDIYNMVELNTVLPECERHQKHVPPWVDVLIRDAASNEPLADGETGIISFLDASSLSYPAFILSEDIGIVSENQCPCGRRGKTLKVLRRMSNIESRGCALKMAVGVGPRHAESGRFFQSFYRNPTAQRRGS